MNIRFQAHGMCRQTKPVAAIIVSVLATGVVATAAARRREAIGDHAGQGQRQADRRR